MDFSTIMKYKYEVDSVIDNMPSEYRENLDIMEDFYQPILISKDDENSNRLKFMTIVSSDPDIQNVMSLTELQSKLSTALEKFQQTSDTNHSNHQPTSTCLLLFDEILRPVKIPLIRPSLSEIRELLLADKLQFSVLDRNGFDFTSEFEFVYHGRSDRSDAFDSFLVIIQRAIQAADCIVDSDRALELSEHILRTSARDILAAEAICIATVGHSFPNLTIAPSSRRQLMQPQIYIGKNSRDNLCFWVRVRPVLQSTAGSVAAAVTEFISLRFCRSYGLSQSDLDEVDNLDFVDSTTEAIDTKGFEVLNTKCVSLALVFRMDKGEHVVSSASTGSTTQAQPQPRDEREMLPSQPSSCAELLCWGRNSGNAMGLRGADMRADPEHREGCTDSIFLSTPRPVPVPAMLALERVRMIACGPRHSLLLTWHGTLYSCGDNSDGALGLGQLGGGGAEDERRGFTLLPWSAENTIFVVKVAAGGGPALAGSHSVALDKDGALYAWGAAAVTGFGSKVPVLSPKRIDVPHHERPLVDHSDAAPLSSVKETAVQDVSCGCGFTVAVLSDGSMLS